MQLLWNVSQDLLEGLNELDWSEEVKGLQRSWIGKSKGAYFDFKIQVSLWVCAQQHAGLGWPVVCIALN